LSGLDARLKKLNALRDAIVADAPREEEGRIPLQDLFDFPALGEEVLAAIAEYEGHRERAMAAVEQARRELLRRVRSEIGKETRRVQEAEEKAADPHGCKKELVALLTDMKPALERAASSKERVADLLEELLRDARQCREGAAKGTAAGADAGTPVTGDAPGPASSADPQSGEGPPQDAPPDPSSAAAPGPDEAPPGGDSKS